MTLPSYVHFTGPLLEYLAEQQGPVRARVAYDALANRLRLSEDDLTALLPSGRQTVFQNRVGWAQDGLKRAGLSSTPVRGSWLITDAGRKLLQTSGGHIPEAEMVRIGNESREVSIRSLSGEEGAQTPARPHPIERAADTRSPTDLIADALEQVRAAVTRNLLDAISRQTPGEFEDLVLDVLFNLGYGTSREALQRVGKSGDGGIDGIVPLDRLGLQKVYVQAKRWQGQVGAPVVHGFIGALQLKGADKGVLITSGTISKPAQEAAAQARGTVVLIDGDQLAQLMIDHDVAVTNELLRIPKVDADYFEGE